MRAADIVEEGARLVALAQQQNVPARLLGGIAVRLRCPATAQRTGLARTYKDIDVAAPRRAARVVRDLLAAQGYQPNARFNALQGATRLLFYDVEHGRQVDVFLGVFEMCHRLDLEPRLALPGPALSPSDLLLLKLQIVQLNEKDVSDAITLLLHHEPQPQDGHDTLSAGYIARICANDWGWYTTLRDNLEIVRARAAEFVPAADAALAGDRIGALVTAMDEAPKSLGWRLRDRVGRRKIWYEMPEEVER